MRALSSIRGRLIAGLSIGNAILALAVSMLLYEIALGAARQEMDRALESEVRTLANMCRIDEHGECYLDVDPRALPWFEPGPAARYFRLCRADGALVQLSNSLGATWGSPPNARPVIDPEVGVKILPDLATEVGRPAFADLVLPDGRPGRAVGLRTTALPDWDADHPPHPLPEAPGLVLTLARDRATEVEAQAQIVPLLLIIMVGWPLVAAGLAWLVVHRALRPLLSLATEVAAIDPGRAGGRCRTVAVRELAGVIDMLNALLLRVERTLARERRFAGMAAHELRTPLAGLAASIEVAAADPDDRVAQERLHRAGLDEVRKMQRQIDALLAMARAQAGVWQPEPLDLVKMIGRHMQRLEPALEERRIAWLLQVPTIAPALAPSELVEVLIGNLMSNVSVHAPPGCTAQIRLRADGEAWRLEVGNPAPHVSVADANRLTEPWFRGNPRGGGSGLGLAIADAAARAMGGGITCAIMADRLEVVAMLPIMPGESLAGQT